MQNQDDFYTLRGYQANETVELTPAMEDYLEMIYRLLQSRDVVRIGELSQMLHVKPSSASKMIQQLKHFGFVLSEKYGYIQLSEKGYLEGRYLLYRHEVIQRFLCLLNDSENELEEVEKIEHFLSPKTIENLAKLSSRLENKE